MCVNIGCYLKVIYLVWLLGVTAVYCEGLHN